MLTFEGVKNSFLLCVGLALISAPLLLIIATFRFTVGKIKGERDWIDMLLIPLFVVSTVGMCEVLSIGLYIIALGAVAIVPGLVEGAAIVSAIFGILLGMGLTLENGIFD